MIEQHALISAYVSQPLSKSTPTCIYLDSWNTCLGIARLSEDDNNVVFKQWVSVDRSTCTLGTVSKSANEFFSDKVEVEEPSTTTGHAYSLTQKESRGASENVSWQTHIYQLLIHVHVYISFIAVD